MPQGEKNMASQPEEKNPVLQLNDIRKDCVYDVMDGDDTPERKFICKLTIDGKTFEGAGPNKKLAKAASARKALMHPAVNVNASIYKTQQQKKNQNKKKQENQNKQIFVGQNKKTLQNSSKNSRSQKGYTMMNPPIANSNTMMNSPPVTYTNDVYINGRKVCPYYLNNLCVRGKLCPFYHPAYSSRLESALSPDLQNYPHRIEAPLPPSSQQVPSGDTFVWLQFCQNYLHLRCPRSDCKFLHVSRDDEDVYRATGRIPAHIVEQAVRKAMLDDIAPAGVTQPCKAYLEGQCNWYSCPFRHISRQDFSCEVVDLLRKEFELRMRPAGGYRLMANRLLDRDPFMYDSHKPFDRLDYHFNKDNVRSSLSRGEDYLVSGMKNLVLDHNLSEKQREVEDLRSQLNMLHEENERLRNSMRIRSEDEKMMDLKRHELLHEERRMQEKLEKLKVENESLRGLRGSSYPVPSQHLISNATYGVNYYPDRRHEMKRQNPESYSFDELLNTGLMRSTDQRYAHQLLGMPLTTAKKSQTLGKKTGNGKQNDIIPKLPVKKSGQIIQTAARPSYQIKVFGGKKVYLPVNQKKTKAQPNQAKVNKPNKQTGENKASNPAGPKPPNNKNETKKKKTDKKQVDTNNKNEDPPSNNSERLLSEDSQDVVVEETSEVLASSQENAGEPQGCDGAKENDEGAEGSVESTGGNGEGKCGDDNCEESKDKKQVIPEKVEGKQPESDRWVDAAEDGF